MQEKSNYVNLISGNGYSVNYVVNDSVKRAFNDTVGFVFEGGFQNDSITISNNKRALVGAMITTGSTYEYAAIYRLKRENPLYVRINGILVDITFPRSINGLFITKDSGLKNIQFLFSNEIHFYQ